MITTTVTARIPAEIKKQGDVRLKQQGISVSEFIRLSYENLINEDANSSVLGLHAKGSGAHAHSSKKLKVRNPNKNAALKAALEATSLPEPTNFESLCKNLNCNASYKEIIASNRAADYENLA